MCFETVTKIADSPLLGSVMQIAGHTASGYARAAQGSSQQSLANADALYEEDAGQQQAELIMRAGRREKGAARAATGASGARIDEFALAPETEIDMLAGQDAAMAILSGQRRARSLRYSGHAAAAAGRAGQAESLFKASMAGYNGWKGMKDPLKSEAAVTQPFYDGTTGDFAAQE